MSSRRTNQERTSATRSALVAAARVRFVRDGFHSTSNDQIVADAGLTRGALHHHFGDKLGLFEAVLEQVHLDLTDQMARARPRDGDTWERFMAGGRHLLGRADPDTVRFLIVEGPRVLGSRRWWELDERFHLDRAVSFLRTLMDEGAIPRQPVVPLGRVFVAAIVSVATLICEAPDVEAARRHYIPLWERMLWGLRFGPAADGEPDELPREPT